MKAESPAGEVFQELMKSFHSLGQVNAHTRLNEAQFNVDNANSTTKGSYAVGLDLESFSHRSEIMDSGSDTLSQQIFFEPTYDSSPAAMVCDTYAHFDMMLRIENGVMSAHF